MDHFVLENLQAILTSANIQIGADLIVNVIRKYFFSTKRPTIEGLRTEIKSQLKITNAEIIVDRIVEFLAQNGDIIIKGTPVSASDSIALISKYGTHFELRDGSSTKTGKTSIKVDVDGSIMGENGAKISQNKDNISFFA